ncbi:hypothetical protein SSX86_032203 [Deinandra increscens subsp. villosa]|uniref:Adenylate isopentenyltransferase n=1 Tax=Deinandra increscens subsp. villosa TaxID=3103831 RepID=A0AAP0C7R0_9ASTR
MVQIHMGHSPPAAGRRKRKIVLIIGPTGAGKSRLSIDLATRFFKPSEIINSDKMQVYGGLDITTNKITMPERVGVPHHLLGVIDPTESVFTPSDFRKLAAQVISNVSGLPIVVGGSSSLIYSLVAKRFDPESNVFNGSDPDPVSLELRFDCCFIWMDVCLPVLNRYLSNRVDEMLDSGMFEELVEFFGSGGFDKVNRAGLGQAIGIPEFEAYMKKFRRIAKRQVGKILRLRDAGWDLKRIDATEAFRVAMAADYGGVKASEIWEREVVEPSVKIVEKFLKE